MLFGLGFDTATEVGLLVLAGGAAAFNLPFYAILVLPILFAAGMCLMDTIDGVFMNAAYGWAFAKPVRKVFYNITITSISVAVALIIGTIELIGVLADQANINSGPLAAIADIHARLRRLRHRRAVLRARLARRARRLALRPDRGEVVGEPRPRHQHQPLTLGARATPRLARDYGIRYRRWISGSVCDGPEGVLEVMARSAVPAEDLAGELGEGAAVVRERPSAGGRGPVHAARPAVDHLLRRSQQSVRLEAVQGGIQRARADAVAVAGQLLGEPCAVDLALRSVMQDVQPHRASLELAHGHSPAVTRPISATESTGQTRTWKETLS